MRRDLDLANWYVLCRPNLESYNHLLLWCPVSYDLWSSIRKLLGISWVIAGSVKDEILAWEDLKMNNKWHRLIPLTILWIIWKERNCRIFEGKVS